MRYGLILEGGAMRGMYSAGVLDVFLEQNIGFDGMIGVSAGACFGCNFKSRQIGRAIRYNKRFCNDPRYGTMKNYLKTGDIYDADLCYRQIPEELDPFDHDTFEKDPTEFHVVATDMETGMPVYRKLDSLRGEGMEWVRASASMPMVSNPVEIGGRKYSDGGTADSVPLAYFQSIGYDRNVVILTQCADYRKKKDMSSLLVKAGLHKYPNLALALITRPDRYNDNIAYVREQERKGRAFVIAPKEKLPVKRTEHDPALLEQVYRTGRADALSSLDALREYMKEGTKND